MLMLIDGNSFYASCERIFRPDLYKTPIAVLSNNDGIIVAANAECKALGFKRGDVFFKVKHKMEQQGVRVFSSNYTLYADMSARLNLIYRRFAPEVEFYSIDESFLYFPVWKNHDYTGSGHKIRNAVGKETGIPVSVGIAPNKTLAKMCNKLAKKHGGVCNWQELDQDKELAAYAAADVWGVGWSKAEFLKQQGITTALQLKHYPLHKAKKHMTVNGFRTVQELNGIKAIEKAETSPRQLVIVSRSFQSPVYDLDQIITALSEYTQEAVKRIREENLFCRYVSVSLMTGAYASGEQYCDQQSAELPHASAFLPEITAVAIELLKRIYRPNYKYRKVMICLTGLKHSSKEQLDLFDKQQEPKTNTGFKQEPLMQAFDKINDRYGRGTIKLGCGLGDKSQNPKPNEPLDLGTAPWHIKREYLSPCYTTNIDEIPLAY